MSPYDGIGSSLTKSALSETFCLLDAGGPIAQTCAVEVKILDKNGQHIATVIRPLLLSPPSQNTRNGSPMDDPAITGAGTHHIALGELGRNAIFIGAKKSDDVHDFPSKQRTLRGAFLINGARSGNRTRIPLLVRDFKSLASTNFAIRAGAEEGPHPNMRLPCSHRFR
jgi:hypothetical protein